MKIYCIISRQEEEVIKRLKRKKWEWEFLISGEGAESPMNQWRATFFIGKTKDDRFWALQHREWYRKIVIIAEIKNVGQIDQSKIAKKMLQKYHDYGGNYIRFNDKRGNIPLPNLREIYDF